MTTAQAEYQARQARIEKLLKQLKSQLKKHEERASKDPLNWGFAGDLGRAEATLQEIVEFFPP